MKPEKFSEAMNRLDDAYVEKAIRYQARVRRPMWIKWASIAACFCVILVIMVIAVDQIRKSSDPTPPDLPPVIDNETNPDGTDTQPETDGGNPNLPIVQLQTPSDAPQYYGNSNSAEAPSNGASAELVSYGLSVTAEFVEMLPDTYTFFDDWKQKEFRILRMRTVKLLKGVEMTDEFYYLIPVDYATDYSIYYRFVLVDMAQIEYEYSIMYNKTQRQAERLDRVLFGYSVFAYDYYLGERFRVYDEEGNRDERLWASCNAWKSSAEESNLSLYVPLTMEESEAEEEAKTGSPYDLYIHLLKDASEEVQTVLQQISSFENGIYVPPSGTYYSLLFRDPEIQHSATRYINGFATNECVHIWESSYRFSGARFEQGDLTALPDLSSAYATVLAAYEAGSIAPPHIKGYADMELRSHGIFAWYAKTETGVLGIIRVSWAYDAPTYPYYYDDAYYIMEYGETECKPIDRDDLLERLGAYETTYIYTGGYNEYGKEIDRLAPVT